MSITLFFSVFLFMYSIFLQVAITIRKFGSVLSTSVAAAERKCILNTSGICSVLLLFQYMLNKGLRLPAPRQVPLKFYLSFRPTYMPEAFNLDISLIHFAVWVESLVGRLGKRLPDFTGPTSQFYLTCLRQAGNGDVGSTYISKYMYKNAVSLFAYISPSLTHHQNYLHP